MAANFRIISQRNGRNLHLKLRGDFDGMSAMELIYAIKDNLGFAELICIETDGLYCMYPFGRDVFQKNFMFPPARARKICFIGTFSSQMVPEKEAAETERRPHRHLWACSPQQATAEPEPEHKKQAMCS